MNEQEIREKIKKGEDIDWVLISECQKLSEDFIREFRDRVDWWSISKYQKLSEDFIREFKARVDWECISWCQKLSEDFIREFQDRVDWEYISEYQKLSESFINERKDLLELNVIGKFQNLSESFIKDNNLTDLVKDNWRYKDAEFKKEQVKNTGLYECYDNYFIAYKSVRVDRYSVFNFQYKYEEGGFYTCHADYTNEENSFGLSAWDIEGAKDYYSRGLILKVKILYKDVARVVHNGGKIRCCRLEVLD